MFDCFGYLWNFDLLVRFQLLRLLRPHKMDLRLARRLILFGHGMLMVDGLGRLCNDHSAIRDRIDRAVRHGIETNRRAVEAHFGIDPVNFRPIALRQHKLCLDRGNCWWNYYRYSYRQSLLILE